MTKTLNQNKPLQITYDGKLVEDTFTPSKLTTARENAIASLVGLWGNIKLEARMIAFDKLHGTNYRQIRHELIEQKRRAAFEASIGLIAVGKKK